MLAEAGANVVKVGVGAGSICTTRIVSGAGMPQLTAIATCARAAASTSVTLIADASDAGLGAPGSLDRAQALADELAYRVQVASLQYDPRDYRFQDPSFWSDHFSTRCRRIREIFSDIAAEDVQVTVETDFRFGAIEIAGQRINPREIGEIPWVFGEQGHDPDLLRRGVFDQSERGRYVPAQTVCQVFLSHGGSRTPPP